MYFLGKFPFIPYFMLQKSFREMLNQFFLLIWSYIYKLKRVSAGYSMLSHAEFKFALFDTLPSKFVKIRLFSKIMWWKVASITSVCCVRSLFQLQYFIFTSVELIVCMRRYGRNVMRVSGDVIYEIIVWILAKVEHVSEQLCFKSKVIIIIHRFKRSMFRLDVIHLGHPQI